MIIQWLGQSCFKLQVKGEGGVDVTLVIDPFDSSLGRKLPRGLSADILLMTSDDPDHGYRAGVGGNPFVIREPGEYETKGIFVYGIPSVSAPRTTIFHITAEGLTLLHVGDQSVPLTEEQLAIVEDAHILCVPVGGKKTLDAAAAVALVSQVSPRIVLPMHYAIPGITMPLDGVERFCKEMGVSPSEKLEKLKIKESELPQEELRVVLLLPQ